MRQKRILIIRIDGIGDLLCVTPTLKAIRQKFPDARIDFLANLGPHIVLDGNTDVNRLVIDYRSKVSGSRLRGLAYLPTRFAEWVRRKLFGYDLVVVAHYGMHHRAMAIALSTQCQKILANIEPEFRADYADPRLVLATFKPGVHEVEGVFEVIRPVVGNTQPGRMWLYAPPSLTKSKTPIIGINVTASAPERQWPLAYFKELTAYIALHYPQARIVITGSEAATQQFKLLWGSEPIPAEIAETPSLQSYIAAVNQCTIYISSDGGGVHIASSLGVAQVALFQNLKSKLVRWHPWQVPNQVIAALNESAPVDEITVSQVTEAFDQLIKTYYP